MGMMLAMARHIAVANETTQKGEWNRKKYTGVELMGKTLGIVGLARIGSGIAKRAAAFGMTVIGYDPYVNEERAQAMGLELVDLNGIIERSDFVTVHMPLTNETRDMFNKDNIAKMKDGVILINNSRGGLVVEQDLADALNSGKIAAAALDVVSTEPIKADNVLLGAKNCIITPHISWATKEARERIMQTTAENIQSVIDGKPINVVNA